MNTSSTAASTVASGPDLSASPASPVGGRIVRSTRVLVGLEIHVQLGTTTKMFTAAPNGVTHPTAEPNTLVDPVVLGLPGVLPVMNRQAVEMSMLVGLALNCRIARHTKWDRKSYYYPDLPKNYQISQYDLPLCFDGTYMVAGDDGTPHTIRIRRAHLEEDAGKLLHKSPGGYAIGHSIVDLNRAGTPLLEIVTEPDFDSPATVVRFAQELQRLVQYLGVSPGQMQMGHMRFEPNINVHLTDDAGEVHKTAITEVKNLNSFTAVERAIAYEVRRQTDAWLASGDLGRKSTFGWDDATQQTVLQRTKEEAHDYRYFPDPDLPPIDVDDAWLDRLKAGIGELPAARKARYAEDFGLNDADATLLSGDRATAGYFDAVLAEGVEPRRAVSLLEALRETANARRTPTGISELGVRPDAVAAVARLVDAGKLAASKETAKAVFAEIVASHVPAETAATSLGLIQSSDAGAIDAAIDAVLAAEPKPLADYRGGKQSAIGALVGLVMKQGKGLNAKLVQQRLRERL